jgi:hypothetical protein
VTEQEDRAELQWEGRMAPYAAAAAFAAALLAIASFVVTGIALGAEDDDIDRIMAIDDASFAYLLGGFLQALSFASMAAVLYYLYRATKARRPELPASARILAVAGPLAAGIVTIIFQVERVEAIGDYLAGAEVTEDGAEDVLREGGSEVLPGLGFAANLAVALAIVLISLSAMRAGLLSRFMGVFGVAVGVFSALPVFGTPVFLQLFWLIALGFLFADRWPGGVRGPAWGTVEAIPWPTAADRARAAAEERSGQDQPTPERPAPPAEGPEPRPASRKRRRGR